MEQISQLPRTATSRASVDRHALFSFVDSASGLRMGFYRPVDRYDLWQAYLSGVIRAYREYGAETALTLLPATPESSTPVFAVATDHHGAILGGWYANGPLRRVADAFAPEEFAADPVSAALIAEWIDQAIPEGVVELKGGWVDSRASQKTALANAVARALAHALYLFRVRYAIGTGAQHAASRWRGTGARTPPEIPPTPFPDERYQTYFLYWDVDTAYRMSTVEQRRLFAEDLESAQQAFAINKAAA